MDRNRHEPFDPTDSKEQRHLLIPIKPERVVNDGQHRCAAAKEALNKRPKLAREPVSVLPFPDPGFERSPTMSADLDRR